MFSTARARFEERVRLTSELVADQLPAADVEPFLRRMRLLKLDALAR